MDEKVRTDYVARQHICRNCKECVFTAMHNYFCMYKYDYVDPNSKVCNNYEWSEEQ